MPEMLEEHREQWESRRTFVLAAVASAIGLGNVWAFPYRLYECGGAAFLIPFIIAMVGVGLPVMILEFSMGHFTQRAAPDAFAHVNKKLEVVGWWGMTLAFAIVTYYPVIIAYCFSFLWFSFKSIVTGAPLPWAGVGIEGVQNAKMFFEQTYLTGGHSIGPLQLNVLIPLVITWVVMYLCIFKGVKLIGWVAWASMPLPWLMLAVLTVRGLTLEGSLKGLVYYLEPSWDQLLKPLTWRSAVGQVFFSLSLGFGTMLTYASFLHKRSDLSNNAAIVCITDFATSFIPGLAIFGTLGGMAYVTQQAGSPVAVDAVAPEGPGLAFVAFPYALAQLPGAAWWSLIFFFVLINLGINSAFSITESFLAGIVDKTGWPRWVVLILVHFAGLGFGLFYVTKGGLNWIGIMNAFVTGMWGIAFLGLLECLVVGWAYRTESLRTHANERSDWKLGRWWVYTVRIVVPILLGTLFFWSLVDDLSKPEGFLRTPEGDWIGPNCVGLGVLFLTLVLALILSVVRSPVRTEKDEYAPEEGVQEPVFMASSKPAFVALLSAILSGIILVVTVQITGTSGVLGRSLLALALVLGAAALTVSNVHLTRHDLRTQAPSTLARWAGVLSIFDISAFLAICVIYLTKRAAKHELIRPETLSTASYLILFVVVLMIAGGFAWCFYRAIMATANSSSSREKV